MGDMIKRVSANRIELFLDQRARTVQTIRIETSPNLVTWTALASIPNKISPVNGLGRGHNNRLYDGESFRGKVFYRFDPAAATPARTYPFFLRYVDVEGGVDGDVSPVFLAFDAAFQANYQAVTVSGTAPNAATIAGSVRIILPATDSVVLTNTDTAALLFSEAVGGVERNLPSGETWNTEMRYHQLLLRGSGAAADFILTFSQQF